MCGRAAPAFASAALQPGNPWEAVPAGLGRDVLTQVNKAAAGVAAMQQPQPPVRGFHCRQWQMKWSELRRGLHERPRERRGRLRPQVSRCWIGQLDTRCSVPPCSAACTVQQGRVSAHDDGLPLKVGLEQSRIT